MILEASPSKRLTREVVEHEIEPFIIKTTDTPSTRKAKLQGVLNVIKNTADPTPYMSHYAPKSLPKYDLLPQGPQEGARGIDTRTKEPTIFRNGQWIKAKK
jgi:hypothetical protein